MKKVLLIAGLIGFLFSVKAVANEAHWDRLVIEQQYVREQEYAQGESKMRQDYLVVWNQWRYVRDIRAGRDTCDNFWEELQYGKFLVKWYNKKYPNNRVQPQTAAMFNM